MERINLFKNTDGEWLTNVRLAEMLREMGAHDCDVLFVHSSLNFGLPDMKIRKELPALILEVLRSLNVGTLCMPTFTFSFCNGKDYDPASSKSKMGVVNEYFRKQEGVIRSNDPLMSVALEGDRPELVTTVGSHSISENSTYDKLHHLSDGVKFLFLGPHIGDCFTFMHYLEWLFDVDYRYIRSFRGNVIENGVSKTVEQDLFVRYNGVTPNTKSLEYGDIMVDAGVAKRKTWGGGTIEIIDEKNGTEYYRQRLLADPHYFVDIDAPIKDRTFRLDHEMVAL